MERLLVRARIAERAECYEELTEIMKKMFTEHRSEARSSQEARNLLSTGYRNCVSAMRTGYRLLSQIVANEQQAGAASSADCADAYRSTVRREILGKCDECLAVIDDEVTENAVELIGGSLPDDNYNKARHNNGRHSNERHSNGRNHNNNDDGERKNNHVCSTDTCMARNSCPATKTWWLRMKADFNRYIAELPTQRREQAVGYAKRFYDEALAEAANLPKDNHIALSVALNKGVFTYEVLDKPNEAIDILNAALGEAKMECSSGMAKSKLEGNKMKKMMMEGGSSSKAESSAKPLAADSSPNCFESVAMVQLLKENLALWRTSAPSLDDNDAMMVAARMSVL